MDGSAGPAPSRRGGLPRPARHHVDGGLRRSAGLARAARQRLRLVAGAGRQRRPPARRDDQDRAAPARRRLPPARLAAGLRHAADDRRGRARRPGVLGAVGHLHRGVRAAAATRRRRARRAPAGRRAVGHLRADRHPRARAVRGPAPHQPRAQDLGAERRPARRDRRAGRRRRPDGDDRADHDRHRGRRAAVDPARVDRGRRRAGRQPLGGDVDRLGPRGAAGDRRRRGAGLRPRAGRGGRVVDGVGLARVLTQPGRRRPLPVRADPPAGRLDGRERRRDERAGRALVHLRLRAAAAALELRAVGRRLLRQAPHAPSGAARLMAATPVLDAPPLLHEPRPAPRGDRVRTWRWSHRLAFLACWACGLGLCAISVAIVVYMGVRGLQYLDLGMLTSRPQPGLAQSTTGGILDPILGTLVLTLIGIAIATPLAVAAAVWLVEYGRPAPLARAVESGIEVVAGTPDIVIAIFGLAIFQLPLFAPLSFTASGGGVFGRSFLAAGSMMSLIALPLVFGATREGLLAIPAVVREASWALGKTRICTIRTILFPQIRPSIATGAALGMGRIVGDTAVVVVLLGATLQIEPQGDVPGLSLLRGPGSTLTSYLYGNSPAGEGNAPQKAYAAAFVLLLIVLSLNLAVDLVGRRKEHRP